MPSPTTHKRSTEYTVILIAFILILFLSPVSELWAALDAPWYSPYLAWAFAIFLSWLLQRQHNPPNSQ